MGNISTLCEFTKFDELAQSDLPRHCEERSDEAILYFQLIK